MTPVLPRKAILTAGFVIMIIALLILGTLKLTNAAPALQNPGTTECIGNGEMLWESLTHRLVTSLY